MTYKYKTIEFFAVQKQNRFSEYFKKLFHSNKIMIKYSIIFLYMLVFSIAEDTKEEKPELFCTELDASQTCQFTLDMTLPKDKNELNDFCTKMTSYYKCYHQYVEEIEQQNEEKLKKGVKPSMKSCSQSRILSNSENIISQLCNEYTITHIEFLENMQCFKMFETEYEKRIPIAKSLFRLYAKFHEDNKYIPLLETCFVKTHVIDTMADVVERRCGYNAREIYQTIIEKIGFHDIYCSEYEYMKTLQIAKYLLQAIEQGRVPVSYLHWAFQIELKQCDISKK